MTRQEKLSISIFALLLLILASTMLLEAAQSAEKIITPPSSADRFGIAAAVDGNWLVIGADYTDVGSNEKEGSVFVYEKDATAPTGWRFETALTASDGAEFDQFGISVDVSGSTIIVGAERADVGSNSSQGAAYLFEYENGSWGETQKLTESLTALDYYGSSVAIDGDWMAVGARFEASGGVVYVYERGGNGMWTSVTSMRDSIFDSNANFGVSMAMDGDTLVVGADSHDRNNGSFDNTGAVYIFGRNQNGTNAWGKITHFTAPIGSSKLGTSVAIEGNVVVSGARVTDEAFVYENSSRTGFAWAQTDILQGSDTQEDDDFGQGVAIANGEILVGADNFNGNRGKVYQFTSPNWSQTDTYTASDAASGDGFGYTLAADPGAFVMNSPFGDSVYVYEQEGPPTAVDLISLNSSTQLVFPFSVLLGWMVLLGVSMSAIRQKSQ